MDPDKSHSAAGIADTWISYHVWSATRTRRNDRTDRELRDEDAESDRHGFWAVEAMNALVRTHPDEAWPMILRLVERSPDDRVLANVAAGPLEDLLTQQPHAFIDRVEKLAREDAKFRRCLSGVWGWSSIPEEVQLRMRRTWEGEDPL
jgi:Family of unknown function (DUF6869)